MGNDYHHGDLPAALCKATVELIAERGPANFSLREVARRAGVSHAAPAHHFGDAQGLLTAVATEGFDILSRELTEASDGATDGRDLLRRCGGAYVRTALTHPGHYPVMVTRDFTDNDDEQLLAASVRAYDVLLSTVRSLRDQYNPDLDVDSTATILWCFVHGLVELVPILDHVAENADTVAASTDQLLDSFADTIMSGIGPVDPARSTAP